MLIDVNSDIPRNNLSEEANALLTATGLPYYFTAMGKGSIDETLPNFGGYYAGGGSFDYINEYVSNSDALLYLGRYAVSLNL